MGLVVRKENFIIRKLLRLISVRFFFMPDLLGAEIGRSIIRLRGYKGSADSSPVLFTYALRHLNHNSANMVAS